jgi:ubiquinone/menaquinone biosynthesis C-methylase UbiE
MRHIPVRRAFIVPFVMAVSLFAGLNGRAQEVPGRHGRLFKPEDLGELEGPDRDAWQMPDAVMDALAIADGSAVADIGAGGGWFTVRLARRVGPNGIVYAQDVQGPMLEAIRRRVNREGLGNVRTVKGEFRDPRLPAGSVEAIVIVDVYHEFEAPEALLRHLAAALKPGGRIGVIEFSESGGGPGPPPDQRVKESSVTEQAAAAGLTLLRKETFLPFQYFLVFGKDSRAPAETRESPERRQDARRNAQLEQVGHDKRVEAGVERRRDPVPRR